MSNCITKVHRGLVSFALTTAGIAALVLGTIWLYKENISDGLAGLGAGLVLLFGATIDRFELLKGLGLEAKTRIDQTVNEAEELLKRIKELAAITASSLIEFHVAASNEPHGEGIPGRIWGAYDKVQELRVMMAKTGINTEAIHQACNPWLINTAHALWGHLAEPVHTELQRLRKQLETRMQLEKNDIDALQKRHSDIQQFLYADRKTLRTSNFSDIEKSIEKLNAAPEFDEGSRAEIRKHTSKALEELAYLREKLDFRDQYYWRNLPSLSVKISA